jgi:hypothetical protein
VKGEKNQDQDIQNGVPMQAQCPVGFLVFGKKEITGEDFNAEKDDQGYTADTVKKPDEHIPPCMVSRKWPYLRFRENATRPVRQRAWQWQSGQFANRNFLLCQVGNPLRKIAFDAGRRHLVHGVGPVVSPDLSGLLPAENPFSSRFFVKNLLDIHDRFPYFHPE